MSKELFNLGQVVITPAAQDALAAENMTPFGLLERHVTGDQGITPEDDQQRNLDAIKEGDRVFTAYKVGSGKVWIITEADRSATTILLPSDY